MESKETPEIDPTSLGDTVVNTVHTADPEKIAQMEEKSEDYYVDPLEQDAIMAKKRQQVETEAKQAAQEKIEQEVADDAPIQPDMNVSGVFSAPSTTKKTAALKNPASGSTIRISFVLSILNVIYSIIYIIALLGSRFDLGWGFGLVYVYVIISSLFVVFTSLRSRNIMNDELKKYAMVGLVCSGISAVPILLLLVHLLMSF